MKVVGIIVVELGKEDYASDNEINVFNNDNFEDVVVELSEGIDELYDEGDRVKLAQLLQDDKGHFHPGESQVYIVNENNIFEKDYD